MSLTKDGFDNIEGQMFEVIRGVEGDCLTLGDEDGGTRISGPKPWGGGHVVKTFVTCEKYGPIEHLEAENAKLREQGARLFDKTLELGTENAKLRNAVEYLYGFAKTLGVDGDDLREECGIEVKDD